MLEHLKESLANEHIRELLKKGRIATLCPASKKAPPDPPVLTGEVKRKFADCKAVTALFPVNSGVALSRRHVNVKSASISGPSVRVKVVILTSPKLKLFPLLEAILHVNSRNLTERATVVLVTLADASMVMMHSKDSKTSITRITVSPFSYRQFQSSQRHSSQHYFLESNRIYTDKQVLRSYLSY